MICMVYSYDTLGGQDWRDNVELLKKVFQIDREKYGTQMYLMRARTGVTQRVIYPRLFESLAAYEQHSKTVAEDKELQELVEQFKWENIVPGTLRGDYYNVIV